LIDAGGEYDYYTSDITRTFPVGRGFTSAQAKVYDLVLESQMQGIAMAKPGATLPGIHRRVCEILADGLLSLGLLKGKDADEVITSGALRRFYPHNTSHWLGMDVHDVGLYTKNGEARKVEPGMCFTVEPGFYVQPTDRDVPEQFHGIGIRIEDDVVITPAGCEVLTRDAPKTREDIEALKA
jgi:Xaa-Pro aminopeptidase